MFWAGTGSMWLMLHDGIFRISVRLIHCHVLEHSTALITQLYYRNCTSYLKLPLRTSSYTSIELTVYPFWSNFKGRRTYYGHSSWCYWCWMRFNPFSVTLHLFFPEEIVNFLSSEHLRCCVAQQRSSTVEYVSTKNRWDASKSNFASRGKINSRVAHFCWNNADKKS